MPQIDDARANHGGPRKSGFEVMVGYALVPSALWHKDRKLPPMGEFTPTVSDRSGGRPLD